MNSGISNFITGLELFARNLAGTRMGSRFAALPAAGLIAASAGVAGAAQIGVNFMGNDTAVNSFNSSTVAGLSSVQQSNWNLYNISTAISNVTSSLGSSSSPNPLVNSAGQSTTAGFYFNPAANNTTYPSDGGVGYGAGLFTPSNGNYTPDLALLEGSELHPATTPDLTSLTVVNVPLAYQQSGYSVYVYIDGQTAGNQTSADNNTVTIDSTTYYWQNEGSQFYPTYGTGATGSAADPDFVQTTNTTGGSGVANADLAMFSNMTDSTFTITAGGSTAYNSGISAFQIVQSTPEPGTVALLGISTMGLLMRQRRRSAVANRLESAPSAM